MATSFEPAFLDSEPTEPLPKWLEATRQTQSGFAAGMPFDAGGVSSTPEQELPEQVDAITLARQEGEAVGYAAAQAEFDKKFAQIDACFAKIEAEFTQQFAALLIEAVNALCEEALAPLLLDETALLARCTAAAEAIRDEVANATLFLHPDDLAQIKPKLGDKIALEPDSQLQRGAIRLNTASSAILDGPEQWSATIRRAIEQC